MTSTGTKKQIKMEQQKKKKKYVSKLVRGNWFNPFMADTLAAQNL